MANGSMRDALSLLDRLISTGVEPLTAQLLEDFLGRPNAEKIHRLIEQIADNDAAGTLNAIEDLVCTGLGEIQIVDAVIESMRDLLVIRSAGVDTDLVILTADQKEKAAALAGRFDAAALIYNITALEKLRWTIKNSDTPRALLDASLLRFALSEHFMNVDELMGRTQSGSPTAVKKKLLTEDRPTPKPAALPARRETQPPPVEELPLLGETGEAKSAAAPADLVEGWPDIIELLRAKLGNGTASLMNGSTPRELKDNTLFIDFPPTGGMQKHMCESNGRADQIATVLSEHLGRTIRIKFDLAASSAEGAGNTARPGVQRRYEIANDPAVKIVLVGLDATITGIEDQ
jgi:DNA polymerase-3 subunit gamma/tau